MPKWEDEGNSVEWEDLPVVDFIEVSAIELEKAVITAVIEWKDNLRRGVGATGNHGGPYVNTGESSLSITMEQVNDEEWLVGSNLMSVLIAELGRRPGAGVPPFAPIAEWVREKGLSNPAEPEFEDIVDAVRFSIDKTGLEAFGPGQLAAQVAGAKFVDDFSEAVRRELEQRS